MMFAFARRQGEMGVFLVLFFETLRREKSSHLSEYFTGSAEPGVAPLFWRAACGKAG